MIIQGTNKPITLDFGEDATWLQFLSVSLCDAEEQVVKQWDRNSVIITDSIIECPQTQEETMAYPTGVCKILIKWLDYDGVTMFSEKITTRIVPWGDLNILGGGVS